MGLGHWLVAGAVALLGGSGGGATTIRPGATVTTPTDTCIANFVFRDVDTVYIGTAAHCLTLGGATEIDGCTAASLPEGTEVAVEGAAHPAVVAYSSWRTMQAAGETAANRCFGNDFALLALHPDDAARVDPTVPGVGAPRGLAAGAPRVGQVVRGYGKRPQRGVVVQSMHGGNGFAAYMVLPTLPGDSGGPYLDANGNALGVLSTINLVPPASSGVSLLGPALEYMRAHSDLDDVTLLSA